MTLIDKDALLEKLSTFHPDYTFNITSFRNFIKAQPEVEKKGKWIDVGDFEQCSVCLGTRLKEVQTVYGKAIWLKTDYCPNCGADMRGDTWEH